MAAVSSAGRLTQITDEIVMGEHPPFDFPLNYFIIILVIISNKIVGLQFIFGFCKMHKTHERRPTLAMLYMASNIVMSQTRY